MAAPARPGPPGQAPDRRAPPPADPQGQQTGGTRSFLDFVRDQTHPARSLGEQVTLLLVCAVSLCMLLAVVLGGAIWIAHVVQPHGHIVLGAATIGSAVAGGAATIANAIAARRTG